MKIENACQSHLFLKGYKIGKCWVEFDIELNMSMITVLVLNLYLNIYWIRANFTTLNFYTGLRLVLTILAFIYIKNKFSINNGWKDKKKQKASPVKLKKHN